MLDFFQLDSSPEQRRAMFDSADVHHCDAINFEEYLQVINNTLNYGFLQNSLTSMSVCLHQEVFSRCLIHIA